MLLDKKNRLLDKKQCRLDKYTFGSFFDTNGPFLDTKAPFLDTKAPFLDSNGILHFKSGLSGFHSRFLLPQADSLAHQPEIIKKRCCIVLTKQRLGCILFVSGGNEPTNKNKKMEKVTKSITYLETDFDASSEKNNLDLEADFTAFSAIQSLDEKFIGTAHYMGLFPFWHMEYKYDLRDASPKARQAVHRALIENNKKPSGKSDAIKNIIDTVLSDF